MTSSVFGVFLSPSSFCVPLQFLPHSDWVDEEVCVAINDKAISDEELDLTKNLSLLEMSIEQILLQLTDFPHYQFEKVYIKLTIILCINLERNTHDPSCKERANVMHTHG